MPVTTAPRPQPDEETPWSTALRSLFSDLSGMDAASIDTGTAFLELGLDSLVLTQAALLLQKTFDVKISFRELLEELSTIDALAAHLDGALPAEAAPVPATPPAATAMPAGAGAADSPSEAASGGTVERLIAEQLEVMRQQLEMLRGGGAVAPGGHDARPAVRARSLRRPGGHGDRPAGRACSRRGCAGDRIRPVPTAGEGTGRRAHHPTGAGGGCPRRAVHAAHRRLQEVDGGPSVPSGRSPYRRRVPPRLEGAGVPHRDRPFLRLPAVGRRRERVRRPHQRLRDDPVRAQPSLRARGVAGAARPGNRDRPPDAARRRGRRPRRGDGRNGTCGFLQHGIRGGHRRRTPRPHGQRPGPNRGVRRRLPRNLRRGPRSPRGRSLDAHRPRHPDEHARQRRRPRLREPHRARLLEGPRRPSSRPSLSSRSRAAVPSCSPASSSRTSAA